MLVIRTIHFVNLKFSVQDYRLQDSYFLGITLLYHSWWPGTTTENRPYDQHIWVVICFCHFRPWHHNSPPIKHGKPENLLRSMIFPAITCYNLHLWFFLSIFPSRVWWPEGTWWPQSLVFPRLGLVDHAAAVADIGDRAGKVHIIHFTAWELW